jgi:methionyl-tRNA synthetase
VTDLCTVLEVVRVAALLLAPITPVLSARVAAQLGMSPEAAQVRNRGRLAQPSC